MRKIIVGAAAAALMAAPMSTPLAAQMPGDPATSGASVYVQPYVGYIRYGNLFRFNDGSQYTNENGPIYGVQAGFSFTPMISLIGNFNFNESKFQVENSANEANNVSGDVGVYMYDANLQFRLPFITNMTGSWIAPLAQVGAGQTRYTLSGNRLDDDQRINSTTLNWGLGGDFQLTPAIGMRLMAKDYITNLNWDDVTEVSFSRDSRDSRAHNWVFSLGLNLGF
jgi:opacity protein-like surface antigen